MIDYSYVQAALFLQMFLWFNLYHSKINLGELVQVAFYAGSMLLGALIIYYEPHIGYFTPWLLFQYVIYIMLAVTLLTERFGFKKALSLGFLIVFLNSFYWEIFYHVYEFQLWWPSSLSFWWWYLRIPQWIRVLPAFFLARNFEVRDLHFIGVGLVVSYGLTYINLTHVVYPWLLPAHRVICLGVLVYTVIISPEQTSMGEMSESEE